MGQKIMLIQRGPIRDTVGGVSKARRHGEQDVLGSRNGPQRAELANRVVPPTNTIEQPVANKPMQQVPRGCGRTAEASRSIGGRELGPAFADELIQHLEAGHVSLGSHSSRVS